MENLPTNACDMSAFTEKMKARLIAELQAAGLDPNDPLVQQMLEGVEAQYAALPLVQASSAPIPYLTMTAEELSALSDEELYDAAIFRAAEAVKQETESSEQDLFKILSTFDMEIQCGGLCQFFVNYNYICASSLGEYFSLLGLEEHRALFDRFVEANHIDLSDLSSFAIKDVSEFEKQYCRYPFQDFDNAYVQLPSVSEILTGYIRAHIEAF